MNLNHLSDDELLDYLDRYSEDPVMRRVVDILVHKQHGIISDLVAAGMDPQDWTFCSDSYNHYYPGQYISHLKNEISYIEDELKLSQDEVMELTDKVKELKTKTIITFIAEVNRELDKQKSLATTYLQNMNKTAEENAELREKLGMWNVLATE